MRTLSSLLLNLKQVISPSLTLFVDALHCLRLFLCSPTALTAENLFSRKQLALYQERYIKPCRVTNVTRFVLSWFVYWFDWRQALVIVQPQTFMRWHRQGFRLFWRWKSKPEH